MPGDKSVSRPGRGKHPSSRKNLDPVQPGDPPLNPKGHNQYTYRDESERRFDELCRERFGKTLDALFDAAERQGVGCSADRKLILERALPAVAKVDVELPGADVSGLVDALAGIAARGRTSADRGEPDDPAEGGSE